MQKAIVTLLLILALPAFAAVDVAGARFDETAKVGIPRVLSRQGIGFAAPAARAGETATVVLNGAGVRGVLFLNAYAIALYLPQKADTTESVLAAKGPKRMHLVVLHDLTAEQFADALVKGIRKNHSEAEFAALTSRLEAFRATLLSLGQAPKGMVIHLDWLPEAEGGTTQLVVNGRQVGAKVPGEDFYHALLRIWLGEKPANGALKNALLGKME